MGQLESLVVHQLRNRGIPMTESDDSYSRREVNIFSRLEIIGMLTTDSLDPIGMSLRLGQRLRGDGSRL